MTVDQLEAATTDRTKAVVFVSPSNPTGAVYPRESVAEIGAWAADLARAAGVDLPVIPVQRQAFVVETPERFDKPRNW